MSFFGSFFANFIPKVRAEEEEEDLVDPQTELRVCKIPFFYFNFPLIIDLEPHIHSSEDRFYRENL